MRLPARGAAHGSAAARRLRTGSRALRRAPRGRAEHPGDRRVSEGLERKRPAHRSPDPASGRAAAGARHPGPPAARLTSYFANVRTGERGRWMSRLGIRFAIEAVFILAVAVAVGFAHLEAKWIVLVMVGAWLLCALVELIAAKPRFLTNWRSHVFQQRPAAATADRPPGVEPLAATPVAPEAAPELAAPPPAAPPAPEPPPPPPEPAPEAAPAPAGAAAGAAAAGAAGAAAAPKKPSLWKRLTAP